MTDTPLLDARLVVTRGDFRLDLPLSVAAGEVVALLGPNGAGKTTALRALAGLTPLTDGWIHLADRTLDHPASGVRVAPERRRIGVVFQDYLLVPHLSALDNVAFGLRARGTPRRTARRQAAGWLERVGLTAYADRRPRQLSGGQAQRIALARALAVDPVLLLLDEPLAALDARTRLETRSELRRHLRAHAGATLLVTHDPLDALVLADRLVILEDGRVVQQGDAASVTTRPRTDYVARLVGLNLFRGRGEDDTVTVTTDGMSPGRLRLAVPEPVKGDVFVAFPPSAVDLRPQPPAGSPPNTWQATIAGVHHHGDRLRVELAGPVTAVADLPPAAAARLRLDPGAQVWATVPADGIRSYPVEYPADDAYPVGPEPAGYGRAGGRKPTRS